MKKNLLLAIPVIGLAILAGCTKPGDDNKDPKPVDPSRDVAVTGITVSPGSAQLAVGATVTLTATVTPDNATDKTVTWSTSNSAVATVAGGLVTGVAAGSATITAKAGDKTATCAITVTGSEPPAEDYTAYYKKNYWDRTDREQMGFNGPVKIVKELYTNPYNELEFDREGHLLFEREMKTNGELVGQYAHTYDEAGHRVKTVFSRSGGVYYVYEYEYGNGNKIVPVGAYFTWGQDLVDVHLDVPSHTGFYGLSPIKGLSCYRFWQGDKEDLREEATFTFSEDGMTIEYPFLMEGINRDYVGETRWTYEGVYPVSGETVYTSGTLAGTVTATCSIIWRDNGMPASDEYKRLVDDRGPEKGYTVANTTWFDNPRYLAVQMIRTYYTDPTVSETVKVHNYAYDDKYERTFDGWEGSTGTTYKDYKYDPYGNWIERTDTYARPREITYFDE